MPGFPAGNFNVDNGLLAVLDACLVNGANLTTAVTLTQTAGVATMTFAGNHNFNVGDRVEVAGATPVAYNGRKTVTAKTAGSISFAVDAATASPASGTVEVKHPAAGWTKLDLGTGRAGYRSSTADGGMGHWLQVWDDLGGLVKVRGVENLSAFDTGDTLTSIVNINKGSNGRKWWLAADHKTVYFGSWFQDVSTFAVFGGIMFGEVGGVAAADSYAWVSPFLDRTAIGYSGQQLRFLRAQDAFEPNTPGAVLSIGDQAYPFADWFDGSVKTDQVHVVQTTPRAIRGHLRGLYRPMGKPTKGVFTAAGGVIKLPSAVLGGVARDLRVVATSVDATSYPSIDSSTAQAIIFDITGPWS